MINITDPADCCGCTACMNICPHEAIFMKPDALGFLYPKVDMDKCVDCHLCEKVCAFNNSYDKSQNIKPLCYATRHKNHEEMKYSRSGAVFIALSDFILRNGGVIYGVAFDKDFNVIHKRATNKIERDEFKGSKYIQSNLGTTFKKVKADLKAGLKVLFSGTPCQTAGLRSFIPKKLQENLYLVDIVCHAVPSPFIWKDYLFYIEHKYGKRIKECFFRDKSKGWNAPHMEKFIFTDGSSVDLFTHRYFF